MANTLLTTIEYFDNLLGEQLTEGGGGGGSSDFSTAKLTYIRNNVNNATVYAPVLQTTSTNGIMLSPLVPGTAGTHEYDVIVYTGGTLLSFAGSYAPEISGNIEMVADGTYVITGDCTFKIGGRA